MLIIHLLAVLASLSISTYTFARPSSAKLRTSYALLIATIASGTYLVITTHSSMLSACLTGLTYIGATLVALSIAQTRLAKAHRNTKD